MGEPLWIGCLSPAEVAPPADLAAMTQAGRHVVLRFAPLSDAEKRALIGQLAAALPEHSVFDSGGDRNRTWVTVMPVVARSRVLERRGQVLRAVGEYRQACADLVAQYRGGSLSREWRADEHGGHCRFESRRTGQVVEAPLREWVDPDRVDPYFFALFVARRRVLSRWPSCSPTTFTMRLVSSTWLQPTSRTSNLALHLTRRACRLFQSHCSPGPPGRWAGSFGL